ncbi:MAG TPA: hypothetical protein VMI94_25615 [Bryobacteraceae bacterium]|nr:hypothetical protein [Bryobacteraceae bacterium]
MICVLFCSAGVVCAATASAPDAIVENYRLAAEQQQHALQGASMEVEIHASLPKLHKRGSLHALRHISRLGRITYDALHFEGDNTVKNHVIAKYLSAEAEAQNEGSDSFAVTPVNYKFKYKGVRQYQGETAHVFAVTPRHKHIGLFKGEIWIAADSSAVLRESGRLVKMPSLFLKHVQFDREYEVRDGISIPRQLHTVVQTRLVGPAELTIDFENVSLAGASKNASIGNIGSE